MLTYRQLMPMTPGWFASPGAPWWRPPNRLPDFSLATLLGNDPWQES
jgi:hypothetical protein